MKNRTKTTLIVSLIFGSFIFGVSTGVYKHFPFDIVQKLKSVTIGSGSGSGSKSRYVSTNGLIEKQPLVSDSTGIFITYGQSNSTNSGQIGYDVKNDVFMFFEGKTYEYKDPSLGGTGTGGSVWGMVGDKLIEKGVYNEVIFSNCGWGGSTINELKEGEIFDYLVQNYSLMMEKYGRVDGILFHQGEEDNINGGPESYYGSFVNFIDNLKSKGINTNVYLSRVSLCGDTNPLNDRLTTVQNRLINDLSNVFEGPNTDLLSEPKFRLPDNCHFSLLGYDRFSDMWVTSLSK